jgi:hypothetical protein
MDALERKIIYKYDKSAHPILYNRYIDDIIIISQQKDSPNNIFEDLSQDTELKINFTTCNKEISFLHIHIAKSPTNSLILSTYYKFASSVLRPFLKNNNKERKVIISQILHVWRISNHNTTFSRQIQQRVRDLELQKTSGNTIVSLKYFLSPVRNTTINPNS